MSTALDLAGIAFVTIILFTGTERMALWQRVTLVAVKLVPLTVLISTFGPRGMTLVAGLVLVFGDAISRLAAEPAGRAHLMAGLSAGALFASGPFGAVVTGATLSVLAATAGGPRKSTATATDIALTLFVPAVVIVGFAVAASAQTGDPFALTADAPHTLSRLSAALPGWPAPAVAFAVLPLLAANAIFGGTALALIGGVAAALLTFRGTLDGIAEGALIAGFAAGTLPVRAVRSWGFARLVASGAGAIVLCLAIQRHTGDLPPPPYAIWRIAPASLDHPPPWGIDHAR